MSKKKVDQNAALTKKDKNFVHPEKNLISLGFFSTSTTNRDKGTPKVIEFKRHNANGDVKTVKVTIAPVVLYGIPTTADQDKYMAFLKILDNQRQQYGKLKNPITFTSYELLKIQNKETSAGKNYKDVENWLKLMQTTSIISEGAVYLANKKKYASDAFSVFDRVKTVGEELDDGSVANRNYVWLSDWQLENYNEFYQFPSDYDTYKLLKNSTSKILSNFLQIWLYATSEHGKFEKRYDELCQLLGLKVYKFLSKIKEKLAPSLDELVSFGYLKKWEIKRTKAKDGFKVIFFHGEKFYRDRQINQKLLKPQENIDNEDSLFTTLHKEFGIKKGKARKLIERNRSEVEKQVAALNYRTDVNDPAAFLIRAIENSYSLPKKYEQSRVRNNNHDEPNVKCSFCDQYGLRLIASDLDSMGVPRTCTHDAGIESELTEQDFETASFSDY